MFESLASGTMQKNKLISLVVVLVWLGAMFFLSRGEGAEAEPVNPLTWLVLPLALIWFGDHLGDYIGPAAQGRRITHTSPGWLVKFFGWIFLLALIVFSLNEAVSSNRVGH